jgi:uncharacterized integral membrane protein (TIGR00697 family)
MINELVFILVTLLSLFVVLLFLRIGRVWLMIVPIFLLIMTNIFAPQMMSAFGFVTTLGVPLYAAIFLATDIISEHWGKKAARRVVWMGFSAQIVFLVFSQLILRVEVLPFSEGVNEALQTLFAFTPRIVLGSMVAYVISQHYDVWVFHLLKKVFRGRHIWFRNNVSTITSQLLDTTIFVVIAFVGVVPNFVSLLIGVWVLKIFVALIDTPFIYLSFKVARKEQLRGSVRLARA